MMLHLRKYFAEEELSRINELIAERGKGMVMKAVAARQQDDDGPVDPDAGAGSQLTINGQAKPAEWPEGKNWGTLSIDASYTPAAITYPGDLKLLNEARESTGRIIDDLCEQSSDYANTNLDMTAARLVRISSE